MLAELLNLNIFGFFLTFVRIGSAIMLLPGFSASYVPVQVRLLFALATCLIVSPLLYDILPVMPETPSETVLLIASEAFIGLFMGALARLFIAALHTAGTLISLFSSLANALIQDAIAEQQSSIISNFLTVLGVVLVFVTDLHHLMLQAVIDSYGVFTPGEALAFGDFALMMARHVTDSFAIGLQLSAPFLLVAIIYYVGLGLFGRLMPTLPMFFFAMPIQIMAQFWVLMTVLSGIMLMFLQYFQDGLIGFLAP